MLYHLSEFPSFLRLNNTPLCVCIMFIHLSVDGHLGCFHLLALMNDAAMNIGVQISVEVPAFNYFGFRPRSRIVESHSSSILMF